MQGLTKTFVIAEAGANHNRDFNQALSLIDVAKDSGANAVKFQTYSSETLYASNTPNFAGYKNVNKLIKDIELPREWQKDLKQYCDDAGIEFMSTPFDEKAVDELVNLGVKRLKIAGFESTDLRFVDMVCQSGLPIIVSLGIDSDLSLISTILEIGNRRGVNDITFLHCNNAYPTPPEDINLDTIRLMSSDTRYKTGLSDHTLSPLTPALAVSAGATVIEKHFTLSKKLPGPDHPFAIEPNELKQMIDYIRYAEVCKGTKSNNYTKSEQGFKNAMRSVIAKRNIQSGEILTIDNITTKRPFLEGAIPAIDFFNVLGHKIEYEVKEDTQILKNNIPSYYESKTSNNK